jgi:hypothetical protein
MAPTAALLAEVLEATGEAMEAAAVAGSELEGAERTAGAISILARSLVQV